MLIVSLLCNTISEVIAFLNVLMAAILTILTSIAKPVMLHARPALVQLQTALHVIPHIFTTLLVSRSVQLIFTQPTRAAWFVLKMFQPVINLSPSALLPLLRIIKV